MAQSKFKIGFIPFMVVGIFLIWVWDKTCGSGPDKPNSHIQSESSQTQSDKGPQKSKNLENATLQIGNFVVRIGDLADDALPILNSFKIGTESGPDPTNPESLSVKHSYRINAKAYTVEVRRREDPGPYRVFAIYSQSSNAAQGTPKSSGSSNSASSLEQPTSPSYSSSAAQSLSTLPSQRIETISDFEKSEFCRRYECKESSHYSLKNGEVNHSYETTLKHVSVEAQAAPATLDPQVTGMGLVFYERERLSAEDFTFVSTLVLSTDQTAKHDRVMSFVRANIEDAVCSTCSVPEVGKPTMDRNFQIRVGKSGSDQIINFKRLGK